MNRRKAEQWMSMAVDGELSARRQARLEKFLLDHPELKEEQADWCGVGERLRSMTVVPPQTAAAAWADVQRALRLQNGEETVAATAVEQRWNWSWAGAVAASILMLVGAGLWLLGSAEQGLPTPIAVADRTHVEWIETDVPEAMSMVYEDATTGLTVIWVMMTEPGKEDEHAG